MYNYYHYEELSVSRVNSPTERIDGGAAWGLVVLRCLCWAQISQKEILRGKKNQPQQSDTKQRAGQTEQPLCERKHYTSLRTSEAETEAGRVCVCVCV